MIISIERAKQLMNLDGWADEIIEMKLSAIEQTIRTYTNNNFQDRGRRITADIVGGRLVADNAPFSVDDTVEISETALNKGLFTISGVYVDEFTVNGELTDETGVLVTRVKYPADVIACAVNMMEWEKNNRGKVGIQSETLSRHSVTYFNMDGANSMMGYPASLLGCLKPYRKARC